MKKSFSKELKEFIKIVKTLSHILIVVAINEASADTTGGSIGDRSMTQERNRVL